MNFFLSRAIAEQLLPSSPSSRKCLPLLHSIAVLQHSSPYSTRTTSTTITGRLKNPQQSYSATKPKTQQLQQSSSSSLSCSEVGPKKKSVHSTDWPRPSEIPWQTKVSNSVNLIGHVQIPVQFQASPDGKYWAGTIMAQQDGTDSPPFWIPIIFEGDLAHIAACHLKEKDCVYIAGQLSAHPPSITLSQGQGNVQVMVHSINFVQGFLQLNKSSVPRKQEEWAISRSASAKHDISVNQSLKDLVAKPHEWWDIRLTKDNSTAAAFEHKDNGQLLWINKSTPDWILKKLECLKFDRKINQESLKSASMTKDGDLTLSSWRDLLKNPKQWWDHRENKHIGVVKAKHPDFKHKDSGFSLWLDTAPVWVLSGLEGLEFDVRLHKMKQVKDCKEEAWKNLVENPNKWWDNRLNKVKEKSPDFKHKETGEVLWLSDSPAWALSKLPPLKAKQNVAIRKRNTLAI